MNGIFRNNFTNNSEGLANSVIKTSGMKLLWETMLVILRLA